VKSKNILKWAIFGMSVGALFIILISTYLIVRIIDGQWASWQLPVILVIVFLTVVTIAAMFTSIPEMKTEIEKELSK